MTLMPGDRVEQLVDGLVLEPTCPRSSRGGS